MVVATAANFKGLRVFGEDQAEIWWSGRCESIAAKSGAAFWCGTCRVEVNRLKIKSKGQLNKVQDPGMNSLGSCTDVDLGEQCRMNDGLD